MGDAWLDLVKAAAATIVMGIEGTKQVKSNHGLYPQKCIEEALEVAFGGTHTFIQGQNPDRIEEIAVGD